MTAGLGPARIQLAVGVLTSCLNAAVDEGLLTVNPALRLGRYTSDTRAPVREIEVFTPPEIEHLLTTAHRTDPELFPLLLVMARTGLRLGEALALRVEDLDFIPPRPLGATVLGPEQAELWRRADRLAEEPPAAARGHEPAAVRGPPAGPRPARSRGDPPRAGASRPGSSRARRTAPSTRNQFQPARGVGS